MEEKHDAPRFASAWDSSDAFSLAPANLPVSRIHRAWDRRPQSPFSRAKVRFGKVWKRKNNPSSSAGHPTGLFANAQNYEVMATDSPVKAVKKMRVADGGEVVRDWDGRGSPENRRIVTRSNHATEELLELDEEEKLGAGQLEEEVLKVEVLNEDGTSEEMGVEEELAQEDWVDESETEEDLGGWNDTQMHLTELHERQSLEEVPAQIGASEIESSTDEQTQEGIHELETVHVEDPQDPVLSENSTVKPGNDGEPVMEVDKADAGAETVDEAQEVVNVQHTKKASETIPLLQPHALPEGFVSPVKERQRRSIKDVRQANANRRQTLPVDFTAQRSVAAAGSRAAVMEARKEHESAIEIETVDNHMDTEPNGGPSDESRDIPSQDAARTASGKNEDDGDDDDEWEDVEHQLMTVDVCAGNMTVNIPEGVELIPTEENTPVGSPLLPQLEINPTIVRLADEQRRRTAARERAERLSNSSKEREPRSSTRTTSRRQTSSPLKHSTTVQSNEKPHLVALSPIKLPPSAAQEHEPVPDNSPAAINLELFQRSDTVEFEFDLPQATRSSSAPPEEPQMSPRKPPQPRISDDTAILQAFLNRAAANKSERRLSETARRESLENRRESDTVRQALASPGPIAHVDVLGDLDPNSPVPRKQSVESDLSTIDKSSGDAEDDECAPASPGKQLSRRSSSRTKKRTQVLPALTYSGPTKISVRGSADTVVLKRTAAQEVATLTRTNTRKNKGSSILPKPRLLKLAKECSKDAAPGLHGELEIDRPLKIQWAETLATFFAGDNAPDASLLTDDSNEPDSMADATDFADEMETDEIAVAMPDSETPSKPKLRRLKPARTASTLARETQQLEPEEDKSVRYTTQSTAPAQSRQQPSKRRSRIATPAKSRSRESGPVAADGSDLRPTAKPTVATKRKVASKLPAPAPVALSSEKENSLITSPPKKRAKSNITAISGEGVPSIPVLAPKLPSTKSTMSNGKRQVDDSGAALGLASPAKKSIRPHALGEETVATAKGSVKSDLPPSLGSPAKKRTRRTGV